MTARSQALVPIQSHNALVPIDTGYLEPLSLRQATRWPTWIGLALIGIFVVGFGLWAALAPLSGGAIAPGILSPDGSKRTVQHLEGGIIRELHVRDGDHVTAGQPLVVLESIQPKAKYDQLRKKQHDLLITQARLAAELDGRNTVEFPADLDRTDPDTRRLIASQVRLLKTRLSARASKIDILKQRILQIEEQIKGLEAQSESAKTQLGFLGKERAAKQKLQKKGLLPQPILFRLLRMEAEIKGRLGQLSAAIAKERQAIGEARMQLIALDVEAASELAVEDDRVRAELASLHENLLASEDVLKRTVVRAPVSGKVVNLRYKTISGVVQPGTPIVDIVPSDEKLIIDARISPMDIDVVKSGLRAKIQLSAYSARSIPRIEGVVSSVSADRMVDEKGSGQPYYLARVEVNRAALEKLGPEVKLLPGMPADVLIVTGERTMVNYLFDPIAKAVWKSFREV